MNFRDIDFGKCQGESEAPNLLIKGFLSLGSHVETLLSDPSKFLVLGAKGAGKSAMAHHILLTLKSPQYQVTVAKLETQVCTDIRETARTSTYYIAWEWILLELLKVSLKQNQEPVQIDDEDDSYSSGQVSLVALMRTLRSKALSRPTPVAALRGNPEISSSRSPVRLQTKVDLLFKEVCEHGNSIEQPRHIVILDDVDNHLNFSKDWPLAVSALIDKCRLLNSELPKKVNAKFIVMCRSELYDAIPSNSKAKMDHTTVKLEWYSENAIDSPLWLMADKRASLSAGQPTKVLDILPEDLVRPYPGMPSALPAEVAKTVDYLLRRTRQTPRDFGELLRCIQNCSKEGPVTSAQVEVGLLQYAKSYFITEIEDELFGILDSELFRALIQAFQRLSQYGFYFNEVVDKFDRKYRRDEIIKALSEAYEIGIIGYADDESISRTIYKYKARAPGILLDKKLFYHPALGLAFLKDPSSNLRISPLLDERYRGWLPGVVNGLRGRRGTILVETGETVFFYGNAVKKGDRNSLAVGDKVLVDPHLKHPSPAAQLRATKHVVYVGPPDQTCPGVQS
ncbi:MAG TPA: hypothetical protein VGN16_24395 [Acidobacteriaceae bacterium]|jgi:hypothetical protein